MEIFKLLTVEFKKHHNWARFPSQKLFDVINVIKNTRMFIYQARIYIYQFLIIW